MNDFLKTLYFAFPPLWNVAATLKGFQLNRERYGKYYRAALEGICARDTWSNRQMLAYQDAIEYGIDARQLEYTLTLTPAERLRRHDAALALVSAARKAGSRYYGVNPRSPDAS